jgi:hypothetical protein
MEEVGGGRGRKRGERTCLAFWGRHCEALEF